MHLKKGIFIFPELQEEEVKPDAFGYWSVRLSDDLACKKLNELMESKITGSSAYIQSYLTRLQLLALYTAVYWAYAILILGTPEEYVENMKIGMNDSIKEYSGPNGENISNEGIALSESFFKESFKCIGEDIRNIEDTDSDVFNPDISNMAKYFIEAIEHYHFNNGAAMPEIEKTYIGHLVAEVPLKMFSVLNRQGIVFNA